MIRVLPLAAVLPLIGCLRIPPAPAEDDASTDGPPGGADASFDAGPNPCGDRSAYTAMDFPPVGVDISQRLTIYHDVNLDGAVDLLIGNAPISDPTDWGVFVLLGPQSDPDDLQYHAFVPTGAIPWALWAGQLVGEGASCFDLAVFGENPAGNAGIIEIYELTGPPAMYTDDPLSKDMGFVPAGETGPVTMVFGDFSGEGYGYDFFAADLVQLRLVEVGSSLAGNLPTAGPRTVGETGTGTPGIWNDINGLFARPALGGVGDDLVAIEQFSLTWLKNDGSGNFADPVVETTSDFVSRAIHQVDMDGTPPLDFVGAAGGDFGAYLVEVSGTDLTVTARPWNAGFAVYNELDYVVAWDLGGNAQPEVIALERDGPTLTNPAKAMLIENVYSDGTELQPAGVAEFFFPDGVDPWNLIIADFNDDEDLEIWAFDPDGDIACVQRDSGGGQLVACP